MVKELKLENISLTLLEADGSVQVKSDNENVVLTNQSINSVAELIQHNFNEVNDHYKVRIVKTKETFDFRDINFLSIAIVLHYLYMYNSWRDMYKKQKNSDLRFKEKDFSNSSTHDILFDYFKKIDPNTWEEKSAILLGMELKELRAYYKTRQEFYNK